MFCSTIIPTINRSSLSEAVNSVLSQDFCEDDFEVIVVNDTGQPMPEFGWEKSPRVKVIITQKRERCVARNTGAAIAKGEYLYFLDDDDVMLPGSLKSFWQLAQTNDAGWLYGNYQTVDNDGNLVEEFYPDLSGNILGYLVAGEGIPLQCSLIRAIEFFKVGGFDAYFTATQDRDLARRISILSDFSHTSALITKIRVGIIGSSTNWKKAPEYDRQGREKVLNQSGAFGRLGDSVKGNNLLRGRVCRAYLASTLWNIINKNYMIAISRLLKVAYFGLPFILSAEFWGGMRTHVARLGMDEQRYEPSDNALIPISLIIIFIALMILLFFTIKS